MKRDGISKLKMVDRMNFATKSTGDKTVFSDAIEQKDFKALSFLGVCIKTADGTDYELNQYDDIDVILQESADNVSFADVDPVQKQLGKTKITSTFFKVGAVSVKKYCRLKVVCNNLETLSSGELTIGGLVVAETYSEPNA